MTNSVIDPARAVAGGEQAGPGGGAVRRAARSAATAARRSTRVSRATALGVALVAVASGAAAARAVGSGTFAQTVVAVAGGAIALVAVLGRRRMILRWQLAVVATVACATAVLYAASDEGWPGRSGTVLVTLSVAAIVLGAATTATWARWNGFWRLVAIVVSTAVAFVPDQPGWHRLGAVCLSVSLLVTIAHGFSKPALRLATGALLLAGVVSLAWIGDRAAGPAPTSETGAGLSGADTAAELDAIAAEASSLRQELPCRREPRPPDERLCVALDELGTEASDVSAAGGTAASDALPDARARLFDLRQEVAVRLLPGEDEGAARLELAEAEQREHARADAAASTPADRPDVRTLVADGLDTVVSDALDPALSDEAAARLGAWGWVALLVVALLGYRWLEAVNNRRYGAPILVDGIVTSPGDHATGVEIEAAIRNRVAELDLREPPPMPGAASTAKPTADIVGALDADQVPPATTVSGFLARARGVLFPVPGITVEPTYSRAYGGRDEVGPSDGRGALADLRADAWDGDGGAPMALGEAPDVPPRADDDLRDRDLRDRDLRDRDLRDRDLGLGLDGDGEHVVTVRIVTTQGRRAMRARSFARPTAEAAAQAAADFVVCDSLANDRLTPSWARWRSDDGAALGPYRMVLDDTGRTGPRLALRDQVELLETARAASPGTGLVLVELGHRYDLDERPLDALRTHLTTRALHPRFAQPRYRLAMSLAMLSATGRFDEHWLQPERADDRRQIADLLVGTGLVDQARRSRWWRLVEPRCPTGAGKTAAWLAQSDPSPGAQREILKVFLLVARSELRSLEWRMSYAGLLAGASRQAERHVWLGLLRDPERRRAYRYRYRSARWIAELRLALLPSQPGTQKARELRRKVDAMAARRDVGSAALYNAACFTSVLADRSPLKSLERADLQDRAVHHLRRVARGGAGPIPSSGWLTTDPDLVALQAVPAFNDLVRRLADDEDRRETAGRG